MNLQKFPEFLQIFFVGCIWTIFCYPYSNINLKIFYYVITRH